MWTVLDQRAREQHTDGCVCVCACGAPPLPGRSGLPACLPPSLGSALRRGGGGRRAAGGVRLGLRSVCACASSRPGPATTSRKTGTRWLCAARCASLRGVAGLAACSAGEKERGERASEADSECSTAAPQRTVVQYHWHLSSLCSWHTLGRLAILLARPAAGPRHRPLPMRVYVYCIATALQSG